MAVRSTLSGLGRVELRRRRFALPGGGTDVSVDEPIDLAACGVSLAAREMCCRAAVDAGSFARAASNLGRLAGLALCDERLRQVVESEGKAVLARQEDGQLELDFDVGTWMTARTGDGAGNAKPASRAYVGVDGFLLPMVTDAEAGRRLEKAAARRKTLKRRRGLRRPRLTRRPGADQRCKEMKLVTIYDQVARATRAAWPRPGGCCGRWAATCACAAPIRSRRWPTAPSGSPSWSTPTCRPTRR